MIAIGSRGGESVCGDHLLAERADPECVRASFAAVAASVVHDAFVLPLPDLVSSLKLGGRGQGNILRAWPGDPLAKTFEVSWVGSKGHRGPCQRGGKAVASSLRCKIRRAMQLEAISGTNFPQSCPHCAGSDRFYLRVRTQAASYRVQRRREHSCMYATTADEGSWWTTSFFNAVSLTRTYC